MATIRIESETDSRHGWTFAVEVLDDAGGDHRYTVTLSWSDYDHWSHGAKPPERVVEAAFEFLLDREPAGSILPKFDCAVIRRYFPEVDAELPKRL